MKSFIIILLISTSLHAIDFLIGINAYNKKLTIEDNNLGMSDIAMFKTEASIAPSFSIRTKPSYINKSKWGYFYQFDWSIFEMDKQIINADEENLLDYQTEVYGYSVFAVPTIYYHLNKKTDGWSVKIGAGLGLGWLAIQGNYEVTRVDHPDYGTKKEIAIKGLNLSAGIFLELMNKHHSLILQDYIPTVTDDDFQYGQQNVDLMYRYIFSF